MNSIIKQIISLRTTLWVNSFLFYLKRLWIIGKWIPDSLYSHYPLKRILACAAFLIRQLIDLAGKPLYLFFFVLLPIQMLIAKRPSLQEDSFSLMVQILFFLNCLLGAFGDSQIFTVTRDKITLIKYMHTDARSYTRAALVLKYVPFFLCYLPFLILFSGLLGGTVLQGIFLWIMLAAFRMMGEAFQLRLRSCYS